MLIVFLFSAIFAKMFAVIIVEGEALQVKAIDQWLRDVPTDAPRGNILDKTAKFWHLPRRDTIFTCVRATRPTKKKWQNFCATCSDTNMKALLKNLQTHERSDGCHKSHKRAAQRDLCVEFERHLLCRGQFQILSLRRFYDAGLGFARATVSVKRGWNPITTST